VLAWAYEGTGDLSSLAGLVALNPRGPKSQSSWANRSLVTPALKLELRGRVAA